jgi:hypothetical protein
VVSATRIEIRYPFRRIRWKKEREKGKMEGRKMMKGKIPSLRKKTWRERGWMKDWIIE